MEEVVLRATAWDRTLLDRISPAAPAAIDALEEAVGRPLPDNYRRFLAVMGQSTGGLVEAGDFRIDAVADFYAELKRSRSRPAMQKQRRDRYLFIAACTKGDGVYPDFYLDAEGPRRNCIYESETVLRPEYNFEESGFVTAGSLEELFLGHAFYYLRLQRLPFRRSLLSLGSKPRPQSQPTAFAASRVCVEHGFSAVQEEPLCWHGFDSAAAAISCYQPVTCGPYWTVAAQSQGLAERLIRAMCDELNLVRSVANTTDTLP